MGLRDKMRRPERATEGALRSFELLDGSRYYFDPASAVLFLHWCGCIRAGSAHNWPEPPEIVRKVCEARDVDRALEEVSGGGTPELLVYDLDVLLSERRLEPRGLVTRYDSESGKHHVRDPYEDFRNDLSE